MGILKFLRGTSNSETTVTQDKGAVQWLTPINQVGVPLWLAIPKRDIPVLVEKYFELMEKGETEDWCRCPWKVHPDDQGTKAGGCIYPGCGEKKSADVHRVNMDPGIHKFQPRRMRRMDDAPDCPVHTKEGMLLYFFEWALNQHD